MFEPYKTTNSTYIERKYKESFFNNTLDEELELALKREGQLLIISSDSKMGKTTLLEKKLKSKMSISGLDLRESDSIIELLAAKLGMKVANSSSKTIEAGVKHAKISKTKSGEKIINLREMVYREIEKQNKPIVFDDVHYCSEETLEKLSLELKELINKTKIIVTAHTKQTKKLTTHNPDLTGRTHFINITNWEDYELEELWNKGWNEKPSVSDKFMRQLLDNCIHSPFLLQYIGQTFQEQRLELTIENLNLVCNYISQNLYNNSFFENIPSQNARATIYKVKNLELNIYQLIFYSLTITPLETELTYSEVIERIINIENLNQPSNFKNAIKKALKKLEEMQFTNMFEIIDEKILIHDTTLLFQMKYSFFNQN